MSLMEGKFILGNREFFYRKVILDHRQFKVIRNGNIVLDRLINESTCKEEL